MEMVAWLSGAPHSDQPAPIIAAYVPGINNGAEEEKRDEIIPYLPNLMGTSDPELQQERTDSLPGKQFALPARS
ncbi:hypothetical protein AJ88_21570 [Mesorhizobium amorphae CCBAU 01583]|nr:hypothetical protein AJ88_21570 [Mesorhizobium amorphae CCBAU 01583]